MTCSFLHNSAVTRQSQLQNYTRALHRLDDKISASCTMKRAVLLFHNSLSHCLTKLGQKPLTRQRSVSSVITPSAIVEVHCLTGDITTVDHIITEHCHRVGDSLKLCKHSLLVRVICEIVDSSEQFVSMISFSHFNTSSIVGILSLAS